MVTRLATHEYKVAVMGTTGVGKSSLCLQFTRNSFPDYYEPTIEDYYRKQVMLENQEVMFDITDVAGEEGETISHNAVISQCEGFLLVYDITSKPSFQAVKAFYDKIIHVKGGETAIVLVGNKSDLGGKRQVSSEEGFSTAKQWGTYFFEISAKNKVNIEQVFSECAKQIKHIKAKSKDRMGSQRCACSLL